MEIIRDVLGNPDLFTWPPRGERNPVYEQVKQAWADDKKSFVRVWRPRESARGDH